MQFQNVLQLASEAMMLCVLLSLPAVLTSAILGLLLAFFQTITSLQDQSISQGLKLIGVTFVVIISSAWAGHTLLRFGERIMSMLFE